jgi:prepilin-type N-terminal cleavage/methylation domain-containing protein
MGFRRGRARTAHSLRDEQFPLASVSLHRLLTIGHSRPARAARARLAHEQGFSLLELLVVLALAVTVTGIAAATLQNSIKHSKADGGLDQLTSALQSARELSISERRNIEVQFVGTNTIRIVRDEVPGPDTTQLRSIDLEGRIEFTLTPGVPDTPDHFGNTSAISLGAALPALFTTDGSFIDANGDVLNGTVFLGVPGDALSARAVSIFGPTGAMHLWSWDGHQWAEQ